MRKTGRGEVARRQSGEGRGGQRRARTRWSAAAAVWLAVGAVPLPAMAQYTWEGPLPVSNTTFSGSDGSAQLTGNGSVEVGGTFVLPHVLEVDGL